MSIISALMPLPTAQANTAWKQFNLIRARLCVMSFPVESWMRRDQMRFLQNYRYLLEEFEYIVTYRCGLLKNSYTHPEPVFVLKKLWFQTADQLTFDMVTALTSLIGLLRADAKVVDFCTWMRAKLVWLNHLWQCGDSERLSYRVYASDDEEDTEEEDTEETSETGDDDDEMPTDDLPPLLPNLAPAGGFPTYDTSDDDESESSEDGELSEVCSDPECDECLATAEREAAQRHQGMAPWTPPRASK